jgi:CRISPR-associated protein Cmr1
VRTPPRLEPPPLEIPARSPIARLEVTLITRLFGGGAKTRELDGVSWLRPAAFKSALRFWWRAGHAHTFGSLTALREREEQLFGTSARYGKGGEILGGPGALEVEVQAPSTSGLPTSAFRPEEGAALNIAYFSAAEQRGRGVPACTLALPDPRAWARLTLWADRASEEERNEILHAFRLFLVLGGVGSRTRRGAGALAAKTAKEAVGCRLPTSRQELEDFLLRYRQTHANASSPAGLFALGSLRAVFLGPDFPSAERAQDYALQVLRAFRQCRPHPPNWKGRDQWGQTQWPEADAIRLKDGPPRRSGQAWPHQPRNDSRKGQYPRASLGLPIVMHYKDGPAADPADHIISAARPDGRGWKRINRFSSPILLRPVAIWEGESCLYVPVVLVGPCTLPSAFRPLVERTGRGGPSQGAVDNRNVVDTFDIQGAGATVLRKLEDAFAEARDPRQPGNGVFKKIP